MSGRNKEWGVGVSGYWDECDYSCEVLPIIPLMVKLQVLGITILSEK